MADHLDMVIVPNEDSTAALECLVAAFEQALVELPADDLFRPPLFTLRRACLLRLRRATLRAPGM